MSIKIRRAIEADSDKIWRLMAALAVFEKYLDQFFITRASVKECGFRKDPPDFYCIVAEDIENNMIIGILIYYFLPFTAQNKPAVYMKELYVEEAYRGQEIGAQLMNALKEEARLKNCGQIKWTVAPWNERGIRFYEKHGAKQNKDWLNFEISIRE